MSPTSTHSFDPSASYAPRAQFALAAAKSGLLNESSLPSSVTTSTVTAKYRVKGVASPRQKVWPTQRSCTMTCREVDEGIVTGLTPEAAEHVAGCEHCRRLVRMFDENRQASPLSTDQMERIEAAMLESLTLVRPLAPARAFLFAFALVSLAVVSVGSCLLGTDGWRALSIFQRIAVLTPLATCAGLVAFSLVRLMAPGSKHIISPTLLPVGVLLLLALVIAIVFHPQHESGFLLAGLVCLRTGLGCAVPAAVLFWLLLRRGAILSPTLTGATAGGLAGLVGLMMLEVRCPDLNVYHLLVWHWGVSLLAMLGGLAVGRLSNRRA
jgi:hypothetical protein